jgi:hypothetical protein
LSVVKHAIWETGRLEPGPKNQRMGGAGVQWANKMGKSPRQKFLDFGADVLKTKNFFLICRKCGKNQN